MNKILHINLINENIIQKFAAALIVLSCSSGETVTSSSSSSSSSPKAQRKNIRKKSDRRVTGTPPELPEEPPPHIPAKGKVILQGQERDLWGKVKYLSRGFPRICICLFLFPPPFLITWIEIKRRPMNLLLQLKAKGRESYALEDFYGSHRGNLKCHNILQQTKC